LFFYPFDHHHGVTVTTHDLYRLNPGQFLNDTLLDFYFKYLVHEKFPEFSKRVHIFTPFFYKRFTSEK
ncbi:hypothetical protein GQ42DRAFT_115510, partial [Ramicandelaber brevisporus]